MGPTEIAGQHPRLSQTPVSVYTVNIFGALCVSDFGTALRADEKWMENVITGGSWVEGIVVHRLFQGEGVAASFCSRLLQASRDYRDKLHRYQQKINNVPEIQIVTLSSAWCTIVS